MIKQTPKSANTYARQANTGPLPHQRRADVFAEPTWEIALLFPPQGSWSEADYLALDTNLLVEFTDGFVEVLPMPTDRHQAILGYLHLLFAAFARRAGGTVRLAPLRLYVAPSRYREPDLLYLADPDDPRRSNPYWTGADLVVEIVSSDGEERDWVQKHHEYAQAGIGEYWIVDPQQQVICVFKLNGKQYLEAGRYGRGELLVSATWPSLKAAVNDTLDAP